MKKTLFFIVFLLILISVFYCLSIAHSGGTDENGGHHDSTGKYHYHHGYPAHSHVGGCPYDYKNNTSPNSGSNNNNSYNDKYNHFYDSVTEPTTGTQQDEKDSVFVTILKIIGLAFCFVVLGVSRLICLGLYALYYFITNTEKNEEDEKKESKILNILSLFIIPVTMATIVVLCF